MAQTSNRIAMIDVARGGALIAMTIYHFTWDLEFFGWLEPGTIASFGWTAFARAIATTFLALAGVSLVLAHGSQIRWPAFWKRFALVGGAAILVTIVTWFAFPETFIFFGILHAIAFFSLLGLLFLKVPWWANLLAALVVLFGSEPLRTEFFDHPALWWIGLAPTNPQSNDFVPLFPWFSATLAGIAIGQLAQQRLWLDRLRGNRIAAKLDPNIGFLGRHSLKYYLLHQPVLLAALWTFTAIAGPPDRTPTFMSGCAKSCTQNNDPIFCEQFCTCTADGLKKEKLFQPFFEGEVNLQSHPVARDIINHCSVPE